MKTSSKKLVTFVVGAALGTLAGILFAPSSGKKVRKRISKKAHDFRDVLAEKKDYFSDFEV